MTNAVLAELFIALTAAVIGFAFLTPSAQALVSRRSDPEKQGEVLGVNQSAAALARILDLARRMRAAACSGRRRDAGR